MDAGAFKGYIGVYGSYRHLGFAVWGIKGFLDRVALGFARSACMEGTDIWCVAFRGVHGIIDTR